MLSAFGIRSLSAHHREEPFRIGAAGQEWSISYEPGESTTGMYGGNSNWRGPIWMPINHLLVHALEEHHQTLGDGFTVEYPTGSGQQRTLGEVAADLRERLISMFVPGADGVVPSAGRPGAGSAAAGRPAVGGAHPVLRVLRRRHGGRARCVPPDRLDRAGRRPDHAGPGMTEPARTLRRHGPDGLQRLRAHPRRVARPAGECPDQPGVRRCGGRGAGAHLAAGAGQARGGARVQRDAGARRAGQRRLPRAPAPGRQGDARRADPGPDRAGCRDPTRPVERRGSTRCPAGSRRRGAAFWPRRSWRHSPPTPAAGPGPRPATRTAPCSCTARGTCCARRGS